MGTSQSTNLVYSVPITEAKQGETSIYRSPLSKDELIVQLPEGYKTVQEMYLATFKEAANQPCFGRRVRQADGNLEGKYTWETYAQVEEVAKQIGSGIINLDLTEVKSQYLNYNIKFVAIYGKNTREWLLTDTANILYGFTTMPIYDTLGVEATEHMLNETELKTVFLTADHLKTIYDGIVSDSFKFLKNIVVLDTENYTAELQKLADHAKVNILTLDQVIEAGKKQLHPIADNITPNDILTFSYTSGTTGKPKGAMLSHANVIAFVAGSSYKGRVPIEKGYIHISYLPLAHVFERIVHTYLLYRQGRIGLYSGDPRKLKGDLAILKPDIFVSVPRLFNKFYDAIKAKVDGATGVKKTLIDRAIASKRHHYEKGGHIHHSLWDTLVFNKMKEVLGGNVKLLCTGSAPISDEVKLFLKLCFSCPFYEGYGQTEALGAEFVTYPDDSSFGNVGGILPHLEFKLIDVPEMNYFANDKDAEGRLAPRGEILVRGGSVIPGYYKNEAKTKATFDEDGWLHSGDIGMVLPESGALKIIDRRKNIFKLSIGEYIAPDKLTEVYKLVEGVSDIFVYGDSLKSCLIGIIFAEEPEIRKVAAKIGVEGTHQELCENDAVNEQVVKNLLAATKESKLKGFEKIKRVAIISQSFEELGLLTTTFKIIRHKAKDHFAAKIDQLYQGLN